MRAFVIAVAIFGLSATAVQAADDDTSPVVGQFPDTANNYHVYLFTLKKNDISLQMNPQEFCEKMDYGDAVFPKKGRANDETDRDSGDKTAGDLEWVICRFKAK
jgi:hypothetical protein